MVPGWNSRFEAEDQEAAIKAAEWVSEELQAGTGVFKLHKELQEADWDPQQIKFIVAQAQAWLGRA